MSSCMFPDGDKILSNMSSQPTLTQRKNYSHLYKGYHMLKSCVFDVSSIFREITGMIECHTLGCWKDTSHRRAVLILLLFGISEILIQLSIAASISALET
jgi:hypothetical protein